MQIPCVGIQCRCLFADGFNNMRMTSCPKFVSHQKLIYIRIWRTKKFSKSNFQKILRRISGVWYGTPVTDLAYFADFRCRFLGNNLFFLWWGLRWRGLFWLGFDNWLWRLHRWRLWFLNDLGWWLWDWYWSN